jgi:hypothetical protein
MDGGPETPDTETLAQRYLACWNERDPARRAALVTGLWTADAVYVDPIVAAEGRDAIHDVLATTQRQFPDLVFRPTGRADGHHHVVRLRWEMAPDGGPAVIVGLAVLVTERGRLRRVYGFLDPVPAA